MNDLLDRTLLDCDRLKNLSRLCASLDDRSVPGCIIEVGVYRGGSAKHLARINPDRAVLLFDTFEGIPHESWDLDWHKRGDFTADFEDVKTYLSDCPNIKIYQGVFPATLPKEIVRVALAHVDVDMEQSARESIVALWPIIAPGGYLIFDDYAAEACRGVKRAVDEMFSSRVAIGPHPQAWIYKEKI